MCFGLNDVGIGLWPTGEEYAAECDKQIAALQAELPDATIYLNSILPAVGVGLEADPDYPRIGEYNEAMKTMAEEKAIILSTIHRWPRSIRICIRKTVCMYSRIFTNTGLRI